MATVYEVVIPAVLTLIGLLAAWFFLPERIKLLTRLRSDAKLLFWKVKLLESWKDDLRRRVDNLLSDESKVESRVATEWLDSVDSIIASADSLQKRFDTMQSTWERLWRIRQYGRLATDVNDCSVKVKEVMDMRNSFKDEDLITDVPEFVRLVTSLGEKVRSFENVKKRLESTRGDLEMKIEALEDDGRQRDGRVSAWFGETQERLRSFDQAFPEYPLIVNRPCQQTSSSSSSSRFCSPIANACGACRGKYDLSKEEERQIRLYEDLRDEGSGYLHNVQNCVGPVLDLLIVLRKLEANCISLETQKENLENINHHMEKRVCNTLESLEQSGMKMERSNKVTRWFDDVESVITSSSNASRKWHGIRNEVLPPCSRRCSYISEACQACSRKYTLGKEVEGLLQQIHSLEDEANGDHFNHDDKLVVQVRLVDVEYIPINSREVFGQEEELQSALKLIEEEDSIDVVGIWGMGGIGKTTLLKRINNHFHSKISSTVGFDVVIFASFRRNSNNNILEMQRDIGNRLGIFRSETGNERFEISHFKTGEEREQKDQIFKSLQSKNFLLLLDDLWTEIDLNCLGIPPLNASSMKGRELLQQPKKKQKLVITTRDQGIWYDMGSTRRGIVQLGLLSPEMSWQLFCMQVNNSQLSEGNSEVAALGRDVANECGRSPLAFVTVGKVMSRYEEACEWRNVKELQRSEFHPMKEKVFSQLKFSFDRLESDSMRHILFLCTLRPCTWRYRKTYIASLLHAVYSDSSLHVDWKSAQDKALTLISNVVNSGLLMPIDEEKKFVRLHECVYDMLLSLAETESDECANINILRWSTPHSREQLQCWLSNFFSRWECAEIISMDGCDLTEIPSDVEMPICNALRCLRWSDGKILHFPEHFFDRMTCLRVLDLRKSDIEELPRSFGYQLANLKHLYLSQSRIRKLPEDMGNLQQLEALYLNFTEQLKDIPRSCFSGLKSLNDFRIFRSAFRWTWDNNSANGGGGDNNGRRRQKATLQNLGELRTLRIICITLQLDATITSGLLSSEGLLHSIEWLGMDFRVFKGCMDFEELFKIFVRMETLEG